MINFNNFTFYSDPFPHGLAHKVFDEAFYKKIVSEFPSVENLKKLIDKSNLQKFKKFSLSNKNDKSFDKIISNKPNIKILVDYLNSFEFKKNLIYLLENNNIKFGINLKKNTKKKILINFLKNFSPFIFGKQEQDIDIFTEFSSIPINNGMIKPHTDSQYKLASIVIPIVDDNWKEEFNGGTNFLTPKDKTKTFNYLNNTLEFNETEKIKTIPFKKNQLLIFLKTYNSLHSVGPLIGNNDEIYRNSITLTVEKKLKF